MRTKLSAIALTLSVVAIAFAAYSQIDRHNIKKALTRYTYRIDSLAVSVDPRDFVDVKEYGGPDLKIFIKINGKTMVETPIRKDTYSTKWSYPIRTRDFFELVHEIPAPKFDFKPSDQLQVCLFDEDVTKYHVIARWNPKTPEKLKSLSTKNGTKVKIEMDLIKTKNYFKGERLAGAS